MHRQQQYRKGSVENKQESLHHFQDGTYRMPSQPSLHHSSDTAIQAQVHKTLPSFSHPVARFSRQHAACHCTKSLCLVSFRFEAREED